MAKVTNYTPEYKKEIIKLITEQDKSKIEVAKSIGVSITAVNMLNPTLSRFPAHPQAKNRCN
jgi:hypothetical protein